MQEFLPISRRDMAARGWSQCDFVYIIGDAYVDHPSFGHAIISRVLERAGYKVGILSQPDWRDPNSITALGRAAAWLSRYRRQYGLHGQPLFRLPSPSKNRRLHPRRRRRASARTTQRSSTATSSARRYRHTPILIGGIEASLRRLGHYDYWSDKRQALHFARQSGRSAALRHGRA